MHGIGSLYENTCLTTNFLAVLSKETCLTWAVDCNQGAELSWEITEDLSSRQPAYVAVHHRRQGRFASQNNV